MDKFIYLIKKVQGEYDELHIENMFAFTNEEDAIECKNKLDKNYSRLIDVDTYVDAEMYISNELIEKLEVVDSWIDFVDTMLHEANVPEHAWTAWNEIKYIYNEYSKTYDNKTFSGFCKWILYNNDSEEEYSYWMACLMLVFCDSMKYYTLEDIKMSVETYKYCWAKPNIQIEKIWIVK